MTFFEIAVSIALELGKISIERKGVSMEIKIKNKIKVGDQTEIIEEIHTCEVMEKGDYTYLVHHNSEKKKWY